MVAADVLDWSDDDMDRIVAQDSGRSIIVFPSGDILTSYPDDTATMIKNGGRTVLHFANHKLVETEKF